MIITGNIDTSFDALDDIGDMIITPKCEFHGPRFENFKNYPKVPKHMEVSSLAKLVIQADRFNIG